MFRQRTLIALCFQDVIISIIGKGRKSLHPIIERNGQNHDLKNFDSLISPFILKVHSRISVIQRATKVQPSL
jgi:hypothetical protein